MIAGGPAVDALMEGARAAYPPLAATVRSLDDADMKAPSLLPGWSRAHVVTHVARNADSHVGLLDAAAAGRTVEQYEGGWEGRSAEIERGALRTASEVAADFETASTRLFDLWDELPEEVWARSVQTISGERRGWQLVWSRWRELEIHHVDLDAGYPPRSWPRAFVDMLFRDVVLRLPERLPPGTAVWLSARDGSANRVARGPDPEDVVIKGDRADLLAWMIGRMPQSVSLEATTGEGAGASLPALAPWA